MVLMNLIRKFVSWYHRKTGGFQASQEEKYRLDPASLKKTVLRQKLSLMVSADTETIYPYYDKRFLTKHDIEKFLAK